MGTSSIRTLTIAILALALPAAAGEIAPNIELRDLKGGVHKLDEYRGKPVVLNFWATWCVPCATEMPLLNEMQNRYKGRAVFLAVSVDDDDRRPAILSFIRKHQGGDLTVMTGATLENLHDFGLEDVMPGTVFIDGEGNITGRLSGALKRPQLEERMKNLAGEPAAIPSARKSARPRSKK
jgi:thiol-disulfide isomerase/thioredoxin